MTKSNQLFLALIISVVFTRPAYAYLDPGTGSMLLQLLLGGVAGFVVIGKLYWAKLKGFFVSSGSDLENKKRGDIDDTVDR